MEVVANVVVGAACVFLVSVVEKTVRLMFTVVGMAPNDEDVVVVRSKDVPAAVVVGAAAAVVVVGEAAAVEVVGAAAAVVVTGAADGVGTGAAVDGDTAGEGAAGAGAGEGTEAVEGVVLPLQT